MTASGFLNGYTDGTFRPDDEITRAEATQVLNKIIQKMSQDL